MSNVEQLVREALLRHEAEAPVPDPFGARPVAVRARRRQVRNVVGAGLVALVVALGSVSGLGALLRGASEKPATPGSPVTPPGRVDYVIDLNTGEMTPLPKSILIRSLGGEESSDWPEGGQGQYAVSPDGSLLAFVGTGDEGIPQLFIAGIDGTGLHQMTHDPGGVMGPAWSPDGTMIAYARNPGGLFVLDVATGESRQVTDETTEEGLQFTPDGSSLLYGTIGSELRSSELRTVPIAGGRSTVLIGPEGDAPGDLTEAVNGSLSPDGSLVTFFGHEIPRDPHDEVADKWVAKADGTGRRPLLREVERRDCYSIPAGTWSPDGSRIVCVEPPYDSIVVIDIATGHASRVAQGTGAIWLDDHTLLVEVCRRTTRTCSRGV